MKKQIQQFGWISLFTTLSCTMTYAENLSKAELDLLVKEDIATARVLTEVCPALIGENEKLLQHIQSFTQNNLKRLSNPATTLRQLEQDIEYQTTYDQAKKDSLSTDQAEQKQGCEEILNLHTP